MFAVQKVAGGAGHLELCQIPEPVVSPGKVKIKVAFCGICGTDTHIYHGMENPISPFPYPFTLGHEFSGTVVELGEGVTSLQVGDRVVVRPVTGFCGNCASCMLGAPSACIHHSDTVGISTDGAMCEYYCIEEGCCYKLPDNISLEEAAVLEPANVAAHACLELIDIKPHDTVFITGAGPIGLLCLMCVKACGATAIVADLSSARERLNVAKELGADLVLENDVVDAAAEVRKFNHGMPVDYSVDAVGMSPCIDLCARVTKKGGTVVEVGLCGPEDGITMKSFFLSTMLEQRIQCSYGASGTGWPKVIDLLASRKLNIKRIISHSFSLAEYKKAFDLDDPKKLKVLLHP